MSYDEIQNGRLQMKYLFVSLFTLLATACVNNSGSGDITDFSQVYNIEEFDVVYSDDTTSFIGRIRDIAIVDGNIIATTANEDYLFSVIDTESGKLRSKWGRIGRGQGEYIEIGSGFSISKNRLVFLDNGKKEINYVPLSTVLAGEDSSILKESYPSSRDFRARDIVVVGDTKIALGALKQGRFGVLDAQNNIVDCPFDYPFSYKEIEGIYRGSIFQSKISVNEKLNKFVIRTLFSDNFDIYEVTDSGVNQTYRTSTNVPQIVEKPRAGVTHTIDYDNSIAGFMNMASSEDLICFTYSAQSYNQAENLGNYSDEILCFDWNGNKVKKYILPFPINNFCVDKQYIYGVVDSQSGIVIYRFKMTVAR